LIVDEAPDPFLLLIVVMVARVFAEAVRTLVLAINDDFTLCQIAGSVMVVREWVGFHGR
jgi:hypothetical protein